MKIITYENLQYYHNLMTELNSDNNLILRSYLFNASGTYTKSELETLLSVSLNDVINSIRLGKPLLIFSSDTTTANLSFVIESNYTLTDDGELNSLTLFWHQYQLWNTLSITLSEEDSYVVTTSTE